MKDKKIYYTRIVMWLLTGMVLLVLYRINPSFAATVGAGLALLYAFRFFIANRS